MLNRKKNAASMVRLRVPNGPPAKGQEVRLATANTSRWCGVDKGGGVHSRDPGNALERRGSDNNYPGASRKIGVRVDNVQLYWIVQEDPHCTLVPVGSNEEVKNSLLPKFPGTQREGSDGEQRILPDPPMDGHPVTHQNAVFARCWTCFLRVLSKIVHEVFTLSLVKNSGIRAGTRFCFGILGQRDSASRETLCSLVGAREVHSTECS